MLGLRCLLVIQLEILSKHSDRLAVQGKIVLDIEIRESLALRWYISQLCSSSNPFSKSLWVKTTHIYFSLTLLLGSYMGFILHFCFCLLIPAPWLKKNLFLRYISFISHEKNKGARVWTGKASGWNWHTVTSTHISLA